MERIIQKIGRINEYMKIIDMLKDECDIKFDTLLNPIVIIEILSNSTELYDRGEKFAHYRLIPSLQEYILVSQYHCKVEKFIRGEDGIWRIFDPYTKIDTEIKLEAIDCRLLLSEIYHRVEFE